MVVQFQPGGESLFDIINRGIHIQKQPVLMLGNNDETFGTNEANERLVLCLSRPKSFGEFLRRQVMLKFRAVGIVKLLQEIREKFFVTQWQANR